MADHKSGLEARVAAGLADPVTDLERTSAARIRVSVDKKRGIETEAWIKKLAGVNEEVNKKTKRSILYLKITRLAFIAGWVISEILAIVNILNYKYQIFDSVKIDGNTFSYMPTLSNSGSFAALMLSSLGWILLFVICNSMAEAYIARKQSSKVSFKNISVVLGVFSLLALIPFTFSGSIDSKKDAWVEDRIGENYNVWTKGSPRGSQDFIYPEKIHVGENGSFYFLAENKEDEKVTFTLYDLGKDFDVNKVQKLWEYINEREGF
jgi:hypothetical protein